MSADIAWNLWSLVCSCLNSYCTFFIFSHFWFFFKHVAFCTGFNLLTPIFMLPYIIMDLLIFKYLWLSSPSNIQPLLLWRGCSSLTWCLLVSQMLLQLSVIDGDCFAWFTVENMSCLHRRHYHIFSYFWTTFSHHFWLSARGRIKT